MKLWTISSKNYVKDIFNNVVEGLRSKKNPMPSKAVTPVEQIFRTEMYYYDELDADGVHNYQELIGILSLEIELVWVDIL